MSETRWLKHKILGLMVSYKVPEAGLLIDALLDEHAHELAEEIRERALGAYGGRYDGLHEAADLIDPEVES